MKRFQDKLQMRVDAQAGRILGWNQDLERTIGLFMFENSLFYDETKARFDQAISDIKKLNKIT